MLVFPTINVLALDDSDGLPFQFIKVCAQMSHQRALP